MPYFPFQKAHSWLTTSPISTSRAGQQIALVTKWTMHKRARLYDYHTVDYWHTLAPNDYGHGQSESISHRSRYLLMYDQWLCQTDPATINIEIKVRSRSAIDNSCTKIVILRREWALCARMTTGWVAIRTGMCTALSHERECRITHL